VIKNLKIREKGNDMIIIFFYIAKYIGRNLIHRATIYIVEIQPTQESKYAFTIFVLRYKFYILPNKDIYPLQEK